MDPAMLPPTDDDHPRFPTSSPSDDTFAAVAATAAAAVATTTTTADDAAADHTAAFAVQDEASPSSFVHPELKPDSTQGSTHATPSSNSEQINSSDVRIKDEDKDGMISDKDGMATTATANFTLPSSSERNDEAAAKRSDIPLTPDTVPQPSIPIKRSRLSLLLANAKVTPLPLPQESAPAIPQTIPSPTPLHPFASSSFAPTHRSGSGDSNFSSGSGAATNAARPARRLNRSPIVSMDEIRGLLRFFVSGDPLHDRNSETLKTIQAKCIELFELDYNVGTVSNANGSLCGSYPNQLIVLESHKHEAPARQAKVNDTRILQILFRQSKYARVRNRFAAPVILCAGRNVCRSGTISQEAEVKLNMARDKLGTFVYDKLFSAPAPAPVNSGPALNSSAAPVATPAVSVPPTLSATAVLAALNASRSSSSLNAAAPTEAGIDAAQVAPTPTPAPVSSVLEEALEESEPLAADPASVTLDAPLEDTEPEIVRALADPPIFDGAARVQDPSVMARQRSYDIQLLKQLSIKYICDLMVETKKIKFGVSVCSSEKVDAQGRYASADLSIVTVPYPGVEFFREFRLYRNALQQMRFDWSQTFVNANLSIPPSRPASSFPVNWAEYKSWDVLTLTHNYLRLFVRYLADPTAQQPQPAHNNFMTESTLFVATQAGLVTATDASRSPSGDSLLIHCISGWDRTPLFVSLLRMSLWADGKTNESLTAEEMLYLTIAYDWLLFGHMLKDRTSRSEDIFLFCFEFLKYMTGSELSFEVNQSEQLPNQDGQTLRHSGSTEEVRFGTLVGDALQRSVSTDELSEVGTTQSVNVDGARAIPKSGQTVFTSQDEPVPVHDASSHGGGSDRSRSTHSRHERQPAGPRPHPAMPFAFVTTSPPSSAASNDTEENDMSDESQPASCASSVTRAVTADSAAASPASSVASSSLDQSTASRQQPANRWQLIGSFMTSSIAKAATYAQNLSSSPSRQPLRAHSKTAADRGAPVAPSKSRLDLSALDQNVQNPSSRTRAWTGTLSLREQRLSAVHDLFSGFFEEGLLERPATIGAASSAAASSMINAGASALWSWVAPKLVLPAFSATSSSNSSGASSPAPVASGPIAIPVSQSSGL